jgi:hypothetical protein
MTYRPQGKLLPRSTALEALLDALRAIASDQVARMASAEK